jgi:hypothetical protein
MWNLAQRARHFTHHLKIKSLILNLMYFCFYYVHGHILNPHYLIEGFSIASKAQLKAYNWGGWGGQGMVTRYIHNWGTYINVV